jgi:antitoxin component of RelBE/YafQ-DinJ toxin-antitoxin module
MIKRDNNINVRIDSELKHKFFDYAKEKSLSASELIYKLIKTELNV